MIRLWTLSRLLLPVLCLQAASFSQVSSPSGELQVSALQIVAGRVVSGADKHPLADATVQLSAVRAGRAEPATVHTDAEGRFQFPPHAPGRFHLRASAPGYLPSAYLEHENFSSAIVLGAGLATDHLDFVLMPQGSLHGRVQDEAGEPVAHAQVALFRRSESPSATTDGDTTIPRVQRAGATQTDDEGRYELGTLRPGTYFVAVSATPWYAVHPPAEGENARFTYRAAVDATVDVVYPETFYPAATTEDGAKPLVMRPGQRLTANVTLTPERALSLHIRLPQQGGESTRGGSFPMLSRRIFGVDQPVAAQPMDQPRGDGREMVLGGLAAGTYRVHMLGNRGQNGAEADVSVASGGSTVDLSGAAGSTAVTVHLQMADGSAVPEGLRVSAQPLQRQWQGLPGAGAKGAVELPGLAPGDYRLGVADGTDRWNVVRLVKDGKPVTSRRLHVDGEGTVQVDLVLTHYAPGMEGKVLGQNYRPDAGTLVVLVPAGGDLGENLFRRDQSDLDGGFQFTNVAPGNYLLLAIENGWGLRWNDAASLTSYLQKATPVVVPPNGPRVMQLSDSIVAQSLR